MMQFKLFHGSPGNLNDFDSLKENLKKKINNIELSGENRFQQKNSLSSADIHLGFSFGCVQALKEADESKTIKKVILISPYLFPDKKVGALMKLLSTNSLLKQSLLPLLAKNKIEEMVSKGCAQKIPSSSELNNAKKYLEPELLAHSILEKDITHDSVKKIIESLSKKGIPILAIFGEEDETSFVSTSKVKQHDPLLQYKNINIKTVKGAGHYQIWTHLEEIGELIKNFINTNENNMSDNSKPFGYFSGVNEGNNVANFLKDHKEKFPMQNILTWIPAEELKNWNKDINTPLKSQSVKVAELDHLVAILTAEFKKCGIKSGDRVILFLPMSFYMYASMFALQKMGAIPTFLDSWARRDQMGVSA